MQYPRWYEHAGNNGSATIAIASDVDNASKHLKASTTNVQAYEDEHHNKQNMYDIVRCSRLWEMVVAPCMHVLPSNSISLKGLSGRVGQFVNDHFHTEPKQMAGE